MVYGQHIPNIYINNKFFVITTIAIELAPVLFIFCHIFI